MPVKKSFMNSHGDLLFSTIWETLAYHAYAIWATKFVGTFLRQTFYPLRLVPAELQGILINGAAIATWGKLFSTGKPKELEVALLRRLRVRKIAQSSLVIEACGILIGLVSFTHVWRLLEVVSRGTKMEYVFKPNLAVPRSPYTGEPMTWRPHDEEFWACLFTEYVMSVFHYYGVGLATLLRPKGVRGLLTFRQFVTPAFVAVGRSTKAGAPSLNSSMALLSVLMGRQPLALCFVMMDLLAIISVITVPRICKVLHLRVSDSLVPLRKSTGLGKRATSVGPKTFKKTEDKTVFVQKKED